MAQICHSVKFPDHSVNIQLIEWQRFILWVFQIPILNTHHHIKFRCRNRRHTSCAMYCLSSFLHIKTILFFPTTVRKSLFFFLPCLFSICPFSSFYSTLLRIVDIGIINGLSNADVFLFCIPFSYLIFWSTYSVILFSFDPCCYRQTRQQKTQNLGTCHSFCNTSQS